jgi:outer membrane protein
MRKSKPILVVLVMTILLYTVPCLGADVAKIGVINTQKILMTSSAGKMAQAQINKKFRELEGELNKKKDEIQALIEAFERESVVMSKEKKEEQEREIRIKKNDIKVLSKKYESDLKVMQDRVVKRIQKDVYLIVQEIGKKEGYLLIITKGAVIYSPSTIDITDQLIQAYNEAFAERGEKFDVENLE